MNTGDKIVEFAGKFWLVCLIIIGIILLLYPLYKYKGWFKWLYHDLFGIHIPDDKMNYFIHKDRQCAYCKHCHGSIWYNEVDECWELFIFEY